MELVIGRFKLILAQKNCVYIRNCGVSPQISSVKQRMVYQTVPKENNYSLGEFLRNSVFQK
jgi:hypothetical protein